MLPLKLPPFKRDCPEEWELLPELECAGFFESNLFPDSELLPFSGLDSGPGVELELELELELFSSSGVDPDPELELELESELELLSSSGFDSDSLERVISYTAYKLIWDWVTLSGSAKLFSKIQISLLLAVFDHSPIK